MIHFLKNQEKKTESRSKNTRPRKVLRDRVFYILFCIMFSNVLGNEKDAAARHFAQPHVFLHGRVTYLIKSKLIVLKLIIDRKLKLLQGINCI